MATPDIWIPKAIRRLVDDHFPWGDEVPRPQQWEDRRAYVHGWLVRETRASHIAKSPDSILEKMARLWAGPETPPPVSFHNLDQLKDLGRFRIVANFLGDVEVITGQLSKPYDAAKAEGLTPEQRRLREEFHLHDNQFENRISVLPG